MRLPRLLTEPRNDRGVGIMCHCEERSDAAICVGDCRSKSGRGKPLPYGIEGVCSLFVGAGVLDSPPAASSSTGRRGRRPLRRYRQCVPDKASP